MPSLSKPGTLIHARGREWVVLPESTDDVLMVRPVGGLDEEVTGILPAVEPVASTTFRLPTEADLGKTVILPGGEAGILKAWWHREDHKEWRWQLELYNRLP